MSAPSIRNFHKQFPRAARDRLLTAVEGGNTLRTACKAERLNFKLLQTYFADAAQVTSEDWFLMEDYSEEEQEILNFFLAVQASQARSEQASVKIVHSAAADDWKAAKWQLETRNPDEWGPRNAKELNPNGRQLPDGPGHDASNILTSANIDLRLLNTQELAQLEILISKATVRPQEQVIDAIEVATTTEGGALAGLLEGR